ncbi:uncharacterized protein LOC118418013 isoform X1 [Branchiostoma floridae]|uniref:Uncharacterized protein LOC118418013 isoform X1 n=1 Tax=Branchiostoma floridae TaxID=7739 RepID=A0A9J7MUS3_BRAFL|nr:uncharacterized protein LOC118418013 isoform X1 [Branchiostoma floridae]
MNAMMKLQKVLVVGAGFVGSSLATSLRSEGVQVYCTRRQEGGEGTVQFVLEEEETWGNLPREVDGVVWTLPARPFSQVRRFYDTYLQSILDSKKPVIVYGTTGRYQVEEEHQWVDEKTKYGQTASGREEGEDFLQEKGATVLVLAGIWGESKTGETRSLKSWIEKGYHVNSINKFLNLAHVDDIVMATQEVLNRSEFRGQVINVCDGQPMLWRDIVLGFGLELPPMTQDRGSPGISQRPSKRVSNSLLQSIMGKDYKFQVVMGPDATGA